jgi:hypothetical protein
LMDEVALDLLSLPPCSSSEFSASAVTVVSGRRVSLVTQAVLAFVTCCPCEKFVGGVSRGHWTSYAQVASTCLRLGLSGPVTSSTVLVSSVCLRLGVLYPIAESTALACFWFACARVKLSFRLGIGRFRTRCTKAVHQYVRRSGIAAIAWPGGWRVCILGSSDSVCWRWVVRWSRW